MSFGRVDYGSWLRRLLTWDAVLPACIVLVPLAIGRLLPNQRGPLEVTAVALPIAAFLLRLRAGKHQISRNRCPDPIRTLQFGALSLGLLPLVLLDSILILSHLMPGGALLTSTTDRLFAAILFAVYLAAMIVAMFPGFDDED